MKQRILGLAILAVGMAAVPTHAQAARGGMAPSSLAPNGGTGGGSGGGFGGGAGGSGGKLAAYPLACLRMVTVSGSRQEYVPSTFVAYDKAVTTGETVVETPAPTVVEAARLQSGTHTEKAKVTVVQDVNGALDVTAR